MRCPIAWGYSSDFRCHDAAMDCYRRAAVEKYGFRENLSLAGKLFRTFAVLLDALNRHRGEGQQKIEVKQFTCIPVGKPWSV